MRVCNSHRKNTKQSDIDTHTHTRVINERCHWANWTIFEYKMLHKKWIFILNRTSYPIRLYDVCDVWCYCWYSVALLCLLGIWWCVRALFFLVDLSVVMVFWTAAAQKMAASASPQPSLANCTPNEIHTRTRPEISQTNNTENAFFFFQLSKFPVRSSSSIRVCEFEEVFLLRFCFFRYVSVSRCIKCTFWWTSVGERFTLSHNGLCGSNPNDRKTWTQLK